MAASGSVHASGTVSGAPRWCSHESNPATCVYQTKEAACIALAASNPSYNYNPRVLYTSGWFTGYRCWGDYLGNPNNPQGLGWLITKASCPANSTGAPITHPSTCTCNDPYVPDAVGTGCVQPNSCSSGYAFSGSGCAPRCTAPEVWNGVGCVCPPPNIIVGKVVVDNFGNTSVVNTCVPETYSLELTVPPGSIEPTGTAADNAKSSTVITVRVVSQQTGLPKEGIGVRVTADVNAVTDGGHNHGEDYAKRPRGALTGGWACNPPEPSALCATATTDPNGYASFTFTAPEVSGTHTFATACVSQACTNAESGMIDVKVPGLEKMPPGGALYVLIGAVPGRHTDNHHLTWKAWSSFIKVADNYYRTKKKQLYVNDASLVWGGKFDISGNWKGSHKGHRRGTAVDIRANGTIGAIPQANKELFKKMLRNSGVKFLHEDPGLSNEHFHLMFSVNPE